MATEAYGDYLERLREALPLLRIALSTGKLEVSAGCSKGAVILATAALERYLNDSVHKLCTEIKAESWDELPDGQQRYLTKQIATRLHQTTKSMVESQELPENRSLASLRRTVVICEAALNNPSRWSQHVEFGLFRHGKNATERITALMRQFSKDNRDPFDEIDEAGWERSAFLTALKQLIDARHSVAHALPESSSPSPKDAQNWIVLSFWLVRRLDRYILRELET